MGTECCVPTLGQAVPALLREQPGSPRHSARASRGSCSTLTQPWEQKLSHPCSGCAVLTGDWQPLTCPGSVPPLPRRAAEREAMGANAALPSVNLPSTCLLHSRHFVTRTLPARVLSLTRRWHSRQLGSELNLGYPQGNGSSFVRPGWSSKGS